MILEDNGYDVCGQAVSYESAIRCFDKERPDLVLLDINLQGGKTGIDIAEWINTKRKVPFIYTSSLSNTTTIERASNTAPAAYIVKPFKEAQLLASIEVALTNYDRNKNTQVENVALIDDAIFVKNKHRYTKIRLADISYLKKDDNYLLIHTNENRYMIRSTIGSFIDKLKYAKLVRTHKSYAVNFDYVTEVSPNHLMLDKIEVPLSKSYSESIKSILPLF